MLAELTAFGVCLGMGALFRIVWGLTALLGRYLRLAPIAVILDVLTVAVCASCAGIYLVWHIGRVSFYGYAAVVLGVTATSLLLQKPKKQAS